MCENTLRGINKSNKSRVTNGNFEVSTNLVSNKNSISKFMSNGTKRSRIPIKGKTYSKVWTENTIKTTTLDTFLNKSKKNNKKKLDICLKKIDVEGHEFEVLKGASKTINTHRPIIYIEVWKDIGDYKRLTKWCNQNNCNMKAISLMITDYRQIKLSN